jgi:pyruvate/2-oxoglutarate dehydrogenase complex dihydrolipoamide acyltransferase (E2) component
VCELRLPDLDFAGARIFVSAWHAKVGQRVVERDRLVEVVAQDVTVDLPSPVSGILVEQCVRIDEELQTGQLLARIRPD